MIEQDLAKEKELEDVFQMDNSAEIEDLIRKETKAFQTFLMNNPVGQLILQKHKYYKNNTSVEYRNLCVQAFFQVLSLILQWRDSQQGVNPDSNKYISNNFFCVQSAKTLMNIFSFDVLSELENLVTWIAKLGVKETHNGLDLVDRGLILGGIVRSIYEESRKIQTERILEENKKRENELRIQELAMKNLRSNMMKFAKNTTDPDFKDCDLIQKKVAFLYRVQIASQNGDSNSKEALIGWIKEQSEAFFKHENFVKPDTSDFKITLDDFLINAVHHAVETNFGYNRDLKVLSNYDWHSSMDDKSNLPGGDNFRNRLGYHRDNLIKRGLFLRCCLDIELMADPTKLDFSDFMETAFHEDVRNRQRVFVSPPGSGKDFCLRSYCMSLNNRTDEQVVIQFRTLQDMDSFYFDLRSLQEIGFISKDVKILPLSGRKSNSVKEMQEATILLTTHQRIAGEVPGHIYDARIDIGDEKNPKTMTRHRTVIINELPPTQITYKLKTEDIMAIGTAMKTFANDGWRGLKQARKQDIKENLFSSDKNSHLRRKCEELSKKIFNICFEETEEASAKAKEAMNVSLTKSEKKVMASKKKRKDLNGAIDKAEALAYMGRINKILRASSATTTPLSKSTGRQRFSMFGGIIAAQVIAYFIDRENSEKESAAVLKTDTDKNGIKGCKLVIDMPSPVYFPFNEIDDIPVLIMDGTGDITFEGSQKFKIVKPNNENIKRTLNLAKSIDIIKDTDSVNRRIIDAESFLEVMEGYKKVVDEARFVCTKDDPGIILAPKTLNLEFLKRQDEAGVAIPDEYMKFINQSEGTLDLVGWMDSVVNRPEEYLDPARYDTDLRKRCFLVYYQSGKERSTSEFQTARHLFFASKFIQNIDAWKTHKVASDMESTGVVNHENGWVEDFSCLYPGIAAMIQCCYRTNLRKIGQTWKMVAKDILPYLKENNSPDYQEKFYGITLHFTEDFLDDVANRKGSIGERNRHDPMTLFLNRFDSFEYKGKECDMLDIWDDDKMRAKYALKKALTRRESYTRYCALVMESEDILDGKPFNAKILKAVDENGDQISNSVMARGIMRVLDRINKEMNVAYVLIRNHRSKNNAKYRVVQKDKVISAIGLADENLDVWRVVKDNSKTNANQNPDLYVDIALDDYKKEVEQNWQEGLEAIRLENMTPEERYLASHTETVSKNVEEVVTELTDHLETELQKVASSNPESISPIKKEETEMNPKNVEKNLSAASNENTENLLKQIEELKKQLSLKDEELRKEREKVEIQAKTIDSQAQSLAKQIDQNSKLVQKLLETNSL